MSNCCPDGTRKPSGDELEPDQFAGLYERDLREFLADESPKPRCPGPPPLPSSEVCAQHQRSHAALLQLFARGVPTGPVTPR